ncbi:Lrp/AsnC family transcriptional regulator [Pseudoclavibacter sp. AY1F1]|uniref:Lrp/AsnC family transcriptional regulator n=1 Tax=Pseudoclavibacter sp. AY1F1 TaxID=2080583 RepID=UPI0011B00496|nr:Lrp/AsnC family transcriptional regulator [Pseudoclavibacter sp. AY1F1]
MSKSDRLILTELSKDGKLTNRELASRVGLARSTCHGRVRALEAAGVIRGYHAEIDSVSTGTSVEALVSVGMLATVRSQVTQVMPRLRAIPGVQRVYLVGGDYDFLLHVACASVPALRDLIRIHLTADGSFGSTRTQIVFERMEGGAPLG